MGVPSVDLLTDPVLHLGSSTCKPWLVVKLPALPAPGIIGGNHHVRPGNKPNGLPAVVACLDSLRYCFPEQTCCPTFCRSISAYICCDFLKVGSTNLSLQGIHLLPSFWTLYFGKTIVASTRSEVRSRYLQDLSSLRMKISSGSLSVADDVADQQFAAALLGLLPLVLGGDQTSLPPGPN